MVTSDARDASTSLAGIALLRLRFAEKPEPWCYNIVVSRFAAESVTKAKEKIMTNEEMQKAMEFIVNQQAQSSAKIDAITDAHREALKADEIRRVESEERWKRSDERWQRSDERWERTEEGIRALLAIAEIHEREIGNLSEATRRTDERLNALINVVERQISEGRNGKP